MAKKIVKKPGPKLKTPAMPKGKSMEPKANGKPKFVGKTGTSTAKVELSKDEVAERADELATLLVKIDEQKEALKLYAKGERAEIKGDEEQAKKLGDAVLTHREERLVDVEFTVHGDEVVTTRTDTGEILDRRPATDKDKQGDMFGGG